MQISNSLIRGGVSRPYILNSIVYSVLSYCFSSLYLYIKRGENKKQHNRGKRDTIAWVSATNFQDEGAQARRLCRPEPRRLCHVWQANHQPPPFQLKKKFGGGKSQKKAKGAAGGARAGLPTQAARLRVSILC